MERKKRSRDGGEDRERAKKKKHHHRSRKGKKAESDYETSSESESYTSSESSTGTDSSCRVERSRKKKVNRGRKRDYEKDGDYSDRVARSRKRKHKRSRRAREGKNQTAKGTVKKVLDADTTDYSDYEPEVEPLNCFGDVAVVSKNTYYRSNFKTAIKELKSISFNDQHVFEMKKTPFWLLFNAIHSCDSDKLSARCAKYEEDIREVMMTFNVKYNYFAIANKTMRVTSSDVNLILGVCGGDEKIPVKGSEKDHPPWICRRFATEISSTVGKFVLYKNSLFAKLEQTIESRDESSMRDVTRLTICYLLAALLSPLRSAAISSHVTWCLEKMEHVHRYDWCSYVVDILHSQICSSKNLKTGGCAILLAFWLCEHTNLVAPVDDTAFPRFLRWDLGELNERLVNVNLKKLKPKNLRRVTLNPTSGEKLVLKEMVEFWEAVPENDLEEEIQQVYRTPTISGTAPVSALGSETFEDFQPMGELGNREVLSTSVAVPNAEPSSSKQRKCILDQQLIKDDHEARDQVQRVVDEINCGDDETNLSESLSEKSKKFEAQVAFYERVVDSKSVEINKLQKELEDIKKAFERKEDELARLRVENEELLKRLGVPLEQTMTQFCEDPENLAKIKEFEDQTLAKLVPEKNLVENDLVYGAYENRMENEEAGMDGGDVPCEVVDRGAPADGRLEGDGSMELEEAGLDGGDIACKFIDHGAPADGRLEGDDNVETPVRVRLVATDTVKVELLVNEKAMQAVGAVEAPSDVEKTPPVQAQGDISLPTPGTIVRAVKARTDRKPVVMTPPPNTNELLLLEKVRNGERRANLKLAQPDLVAAQNSSSDANLGLVGGKEEGGSRGIMWKGQWAFNGETIAVDDVDEDEGPDPEDPTELPLNYTCPAVKKCSPTAIYGLTDCWNENRSRGLVWKGKGSISEVRMMDALAILHHESLSTWVVDSWSELIQKKYAEKKIGSRTIIFSSACWDLINMRTAAGENKSLKKLVDTPLSNIVSYSQLLFPLLTSGPSGVGKDVGNHWTLLRLDLRSCGWHFYNSMRPRSEKTADVHMKRAYVVVEYVENYLRELMSRKMSSHKLLKYAPKEVVHSACPQQVPESKDCGVVCCQNIENLLAEKGCVNKDFSIRNSGDYRARMIGIFTDPLDSTV